MKEEATNIEVLCACGVIITTSEDVINSYCHTCGAPIKLPPK